jgi:6-phosphogluconolactonase
MLLPPLTIEVHADAAAVSRRAADWIAAIARQAIAQRDRFVLALSGGNTPWRMLRLLATETIDWNKVHVAQVDERVAPAGSLDRNLTHLRETLLARVTLPPAQVHPMPVDDADLDAAAERYARLLARLAGSPPLLDLVQLGLGADGHTASLVPGDAVLDVRRTDVAVTAVYKGRRRMTLTFPLINRARHILWLVTGDDKADAVARLVQGDPSMPASHVRREPALLLVDRDAAALLPSRTTR